MHPELTKRIVDSVRRRHEQGDCPTEAAQPTETLEFALLSLADDLARTEDRVVKEMEYANASRNTAARLHEALTRLERPAPGVKMLPPWAVGIIHSVLGRPVPPHGSGP